MIYYFKKIEPLSLQNVDLSPSSVGQSPSVLTQIQFPTPLSPPDYDNLVQSMTDQGYDVATQASSSLEGAQANKVTLATAAGQLVYMTALGAFFLDAAGETSVMLDGNPLDYGPDYSHHRRRNAPASVADAAIGIELANDPGNGRVLVVQWTERRLLDAPVLEIQPVRLSGGVPDYSVGWLPGAGSPDAPNGITVPARDCYSLEFWRETAHRGGVGSRAYAPRSGRRFLPYYRGAADVWTFDRSAFCSSAPAQKCWKFRVCYYNSASGARGPLSQDVILCQRTARPDKANGADRRAAGSVWLQ